MVSYDEHEIETLITPLIVMLKAAQDQAKITFLELSPEILIETRFKNAITKCNLIERKLIKNISLKKTTPLTAEEYQILFELKNNSEQLITKKDLMVLEVYYKNNKEAFNLQSPQQEKINLERCKKAIITIQASAEKIINELIAQKLIQL